MLQRTSAKLLQQSRHYVRAIFCGSLTASGAMLLFFALNYASLGRGGQERIAEAFANGSLGPDNYLKGDTDRGVHQYNDCLILGMAMDQRYSKAELTVSPSHPFGAQENICAGLQTGRSYTQRDFYHNYVHGHTLLARYLLPTLGVEGMRSLYRNSISVVLMIGIGLCMVRLAQGRRQAAVFLVALLGFARFFGLESFGQSLSHAPADLVLISYVFWLAFRAEEIGRSHAIVVAALFGALTMVFEFMTGGLPLGLATVIGLTWFALRSPNVRDCAAAAVAFVTSAVGVLVIKYAAVAIVFGGGEVLHIAQFATFRIDGQLPPDRAGVSLASAVIGGLNALTPGLDKVGRLMVFLSICFGLWTLRQDRRPEIILLAVSNAVILGWVILFRQHTIVHAWFMDRIFVWTIISGWLMFLLTLQAGSQFRRSQLTGRT